jgi:predicted transposase/invertase (TIGR01784 family)
MQDRLAIYGSKLKQTADYHTDFFLRNSDGSTVLTKALEFHLFELSKIPRNEDGRHVWRRLKFLSAGTQEEFDMLQQTYDELQKPVARLMEMSADEIFRHRKDAWDKARWDEEARIRLNRAEGIAEGKAEVALNLLKAGLSIGMVTQVTGLSSDALERLSNAQ